MAWEQRGAQRYYYRSTKRHGRVLRTYVGGGLLGELAAAEDTARQHQRQDAAEAWRQERARLDTLHQQMTAWWDASTLVLQVLLTGEECYRHDRGPWRKRRPTQDASTDSCDAQRP